METNWKKLDDITEITIEEIEKVFPEFISGVFKDRIRRILKAKFTSFSSSKLKEIRGKVGNWHIITGNENERNGSEFTRGYVLSLIDEEITKLQ